MKLAIRSAPHTFANWASEGQWRCYPHLAYIGKQIALEMSLAAAEGRGARLVINVGPRFGKSWLISKWLPIWFLENNPTKKVLMVSYSAELAENWGREVRDEFEKNKNLTLKVREDVASVSTWMTRQGGGMKAAGIGSGIVGFGFHCFPKSVILQTEIGPRSIKDIAEDSFPPRVLSYNHRIGRLEYCRVVASRSKSVSELTVTRTASGKILPSTPDHRHYSIQRGYTEARNLQPGEGLVALQGHTLHGMRRRKGRDNRTGLQGVLRETSIPGDSSRLRCVQEGVSSPGLRYEEKGKGGLCGNLLFTKMYQQGIPREVSEAVRMRRAGEAVEIQILPDVLAGESQISSEEIETYYVSELREIASTFDSQNLFLQHELQESVSFQEHDRAREFSFQNRNELRETISRDEIIDFGEGSPCVHGLRSSPTNEPFPQIRNPEAEDESVYTSYRHESSKQQKQESDYSMCVVSQEASQTDRQWEADTISVVETISCNEQQVYDIQVEGNCNFFANEILVHNCGIIDDPVKDWQSSISPLEQSAFRNWFDSTFFTRKEPGAHIVMLMQRWNAKDPSGYLIKQHTDPWKVIRIHAIAEENDPLGRKVGEGLCEERVPLRDLLASRAANKVVFDSMYQQNPPDELGDRVYDHFQEADNTDKSIKPYLTNADGTQAALRFTMDFNVNPGMHGLLWQYNPRVDMGYFYQEFHAWRMGTEGMMNEFEKWIKAQGGWKWECLYIHGDRSGRNQTTATSTTDYQLIRNMIDIMNKKNGWKIVVKERVPMANPPIKNRVMVVNDALRDGEGKVHLLVHPLNCPRLMADFGTQLKDEDGLPDKTDQALGHSGDAVGYGLIWVRPMRKVEFTPQRVHT